MRTLDILRTTYAVGDFISWQRAGTLVLSPSFQRRPVWKSGAKSYLIDTMVRGLPMPIIFLRDRRTSLGDLEAVREVVDGQQRIRTVLSYVDPSLLPDFRPKRDAFTVRDTHNKELAGKSFSELAPELRERILDYQFSVHVLPSDIDDREVLQIFARMNATGVKLNRQELRNAEYFGEFKTSMYDLAAEQLPRWRTWRIFTEYNIARMDEVELTSEAALLMLRGLTGKTQAAMDGVYKKKDAQFPERVEVERRFRIVLDTIDDTVGSQLRHLPFRRKTLFYSLLAFFYHLQFGIGCPLERVRPNRVKAETVVRLIAAGESIRHKVAPDEVLEAVARRTTHLSSRRTALEYLAREAGGAQIFK